MSPKSPKSPAAAAALTLEELKAIGWQNMDAETRKVYSGLKKSANAAAAAAFVQSPAGTALVPFVNDENARKVVKQYLAAARENGGYDNFRRAFYAACKAKEAAAKSPAPAAPAAPAPAAAKVTAPAAKVTAAAPAADMRAILTNALTAAALAGDVTQVQTIAAALAILA